MTRLVALAVVVSACAVPVDPAGDDTAVIFPHAEDYSRTHMADALVNAATCMSCHWSADGAEVEPIAPPCDTCHRWSAYEWYADTTGER